MAKRKKERENLDVLGFANRAMRPSTVFFGGPDQERPKPATRGSWKPGVQHPQPQLGPEGYARAVATRTRNGALMIDCAIEIIETSDSETSRLAAAHFLNAYYIGKPRETISLTTEGPPSDARLVQPNFADPIEAKQYAAFSRRIHALALTAPSSASTAVVDSSPVGGAAGGDGDRISEAVPPSGAAVPDPDGVR